MKRCSTCGQVFPVDFFYKSGKTKSGKIKYSCECKDCRKQREMERYYDKKDDIDSFRKPCVHCGIDKPYLIEFHHRDPEEKEFVIAHWRKKSKESLIAELEKCDPLCRNCHEEFHYLHRTTGISYADYISNK